MSLKSSTKCLKILLIMGKKLASYLYTNHPNQISYEFGLSFANKF